VILYDIVRNSISCSRVLQMLEAGAGPPITNALRFLYKVSSVFSTSLPIIPHSGTVYLACCSLEGSS
jgi:hypothetical protein